MKLIKLPIGAVYDQKTGKILPLSRISDRDYRNIVFDAEEKTMRYLDYSSYNRFKNQYLAERILEEGKDPGLGIRDLHSRGITGKGVNVAIIDQQLALDHPEYKDRIVEYKFIGPVISDGTHQPVSSYHGPAMASLLVGKSLGVAPGANLYYVATNAGPLRDAKPEADALLYILERNKQLPEDEKIKFVSVSASPSGSDGNEFEKKRDKNTDLWEQALEEAKKQGVVVVTATWQDQFIKAGYIDPRTKKMKRGFPGIADRHLLKHKQKDKNAVFAPASFRTCAESYDNVHFDYNYSYNGGQSSAIPYGVGVLVLGQQINPNLSAEELKTLLIETAENGFINPIGFIEKVQSLTPPTVEKITKQELEAITPQENKQVGDATHTDRQSVAQSENQVDSNESTI